SQKPWPRPMRRAVAVVRLWAVTVRRGDEPPARAGRAGEGRGPPPAEDPSQSWSTSKPLGRRGLVRTRWEPAPSRRPPREFPHGVMLRGRPPRADAVVPDIR